MIDLHFHCLPGIDDGPRTWEESIALCQAAAADGIETIIATPHVLRDAWVNDDEPARDALLAELNRRLGGKPTIVAGCEFFFSSDAVELCSMADSPLTKLNHSSYLLVEFPATRLPEAAESVFHELSLIGVTPVIAHPERHLVLASQPEKLTRLIELGAVAQITAGSIVGDFGKPAQAACAEFLKRGLVHFVATDAHSVMRRPPQLSAARERIRERWSSEIESALFDGNPRALLANQPLPWRG